MPLSETNRAESKSIEDLIAQLDSPNQAISPNNVNNGENRPVNGHSSASAAAAAAAAAASRKQQVKGNRRVNSTSFSFSSNSSSNIGANVNGTPTGGSSSVFTKTNSFGQNSEPLLSKNIITSKKYSKKLGRLRDKGMPKKGTYFMNIIFF